MDGHWLNSLLLYRPSQGSKCTCVAGDDHDLSPWTCSPAACTHRYSNTTVGCPPVYHIPRGPGFLEDSVRHLVVGYNQPTAASKVPKKKYGVATAASCSSDGEDRFKFSHLPFLSDYMKVYRGIYSSIAQKGNDISGSVWHTQQSVHYNPQITQIVSDKCSMCSSKQPLLEDSYTGDMFQHLRQGCHSAKQHLVAPIPIHEINLDIPKTAGRIRYPRPAPPDLWYSSSSTVSDNTSGANNGFQVKGSNCNNGPSVTGGISNHTPRGIERSTATEDVTTNYAIIMKNKSKNKSVVHIDFSEHLIDYPIYSAVTADTADHSDQQVNSDTTNKTRPLWKRNARDSQRYIPHKIDSVKDMEQGFKELLTEPHLMSAMMAETKAYPGRLLTGKIRDKTDPGQGLMALDGVSAAESMSNTLLGKKMKTPVNNAVGGCMNHEVTSEIMKPKSLSSPSLTKICVRQAIQPPVLAYNSAYNTSSKDPLMIVGNPDLLSGIDSSTTGKIKSAGGQRPRPISTNVEYRGFLNPTTKNNQEKWKQERWKQERWKQERWKTEKRSACFIRSSNRRSRKWVLAKEVKDLPKIPTHNQVSILEDIANNGE